MAISQLGTDAPNGAVTVSNWLRNAENNRFTNGIIAGFIASYSGMSITPGGGSTVNTCLANNANGDSEIFGLNVADTTTLPLKAPTTSGQSITYAIAAYRDVTQNTTANNGIGSIGMIAVAGAAATTGSQVAPTDAQIRAAITNGSTAYVSTLMTVTVPYGATSITSAMVSRLLSVPQVRRPFSYSMLVTGSTNFNSVLPISWAGAPCPQTKPDAILVANAQANGSIDAVTRSFVPRLWNIDNDTTAQIRFLRVSNQQWDAVGQPISINVVLFWN